MSKRADPSPYHSRVSADSSEKWRETTLDWPDDYPEYFYDEKFCEQDINDSVKVAMAKYLIRNSSKDRRDPLAEKILIWYHD